MAFLEAQELDNVRKIDITVKLETLRDDLFEIYGQLFEDISKDEIVFEELHGGYVNSIVKLSLKEDQSKSLIFRTFSMKVNFEEFDINYQEMKKQEKNAEILSEEKSETISSNKKPSDQPDLSEMLFDREKELKVMNVVSKHGLCEKIYAKYNNGICYGYTQGVTINGPLMLTNDFLNEMATKLARFHSIKYDVPGNQLKTHYERATLVVHPIFMMMAKKTDEELGDKLEEYPFNQIPKYEVLSADEAKLHDLLGQIGFGRIVLCHNDTNQKNIIWNSQKRTLGFIDFDMSMNNYASMEIGYLFGCFTGHSPLDFNGDLFPNIDYRIRFIKKYLGEFIKLNDIKLTDKEFETGLNELLIRSDLGALIHLLRLAMSGKYLDKSPDTFKNDELKKKDQGI